jgi:TatA/E family protein of Tat protein translocase
MGVTHLLFISNLFSSDMVIIIVVALFLFGGEKLPEIARGLGKGIRDFKDASEGIKREINEQINSFEEKKAETALNKQAEEARQSETGVPVITPPAVENTMPISDYNFNPQPNTEPEVKPEEHAEVVEHADPNTENNTPVAQKMETDVESIKN